MRKANLATALLPGMCVTALLVACGGGEGSVPSTVVSSRPTAEPPAAQTVEPTSTAIATALPTQLTLERVTEYLDASAVLPGFVQFDPAAEELSDEYLEQPTPAGGSGAWTPPFSVGYISEEPFQIVIMEAELQTTDMDLAEGEPEEVRRGLGAAYLLGVGEASEGWGWTTLEWSVPDVGDIAGLWTGTAERMGTEFQVEELVFAQAKANVMAYVRVFAMWLPGEGPIVDAVTIGEEVSRRIAER